MALLLLFKEGILNIPGNRLITKGYKREVEKLISVSLIRYTWVFLYTEQKQAK